MQFFEAKSDRGLERRVDEGDLRNLYRAGYLHLDSLVRRAGSPNWFRVDEVFPHFEDIPVPKSKRYSANFRSAAQASNIRTGLFIAMSAVILIFLIIRFVDKIGTERREKSVPTLKN